MAGLLDARDVSLVEGRIVGSRIRTGRDDAEHLVAHVVEAVVGCQVAWPDDLDARAGETAFGELFGEDRRLRARKVDEGRVRLEVADALQERREVRVGERDADRLDDL